MSKRKIDTLNEEDELTMIVIHDPFPDRVLATVISPYPTLPTILITLSNL